MSFQKFRILNESNVQAYEKQESDLLINTDHIISMKPIKIVIDGELVKGYWLRLSNGKKYRATKIPAQFAKHLKHEDLMGSSEAPFVDTEDFDEDTNGPLLN